MFLAAACELAAAAETQVPLDSNGKIHRIDAHLANQLGLFAGDHPGFLEARLFRLADSTFVLEITRRLEGAMVRDRLPLDSAGADSVRTLVDAMMTERIPSAQFNQEARPLLTALSALVGFGFYGWAVPYMFDMDDESNVAGAYLLTTATTIVLPSAITRQQDVTYPSVTLGLYGATRGIVHGLLLAEAFGEDPEQAAVATAMAASVAEWVIGYRWGGTRSPGQVNVIALGGDLGLGYGFGVAELIDGWEGREPLVLGITAMGNAGGWALGRSRDYSYGDVGIMRWSSILGAYSGFALVVQDEDWEDETAIAVSMAGAAVGAVAGDRIVNGKGYSFGQSISVGFATMSGALLAWGLAALADPQMVTITRVVSMQALRRWAPSAATRRALRRRLQAGGPRNPHRSGWRSSRDG
jgi:hypothetical protein